MRYIINARKDNILSDFCSRKIDFVKPVCFTVPVKQAAAFVDPEPQVSVIIFGIATVVTTGEPVDAIVFFIGFDIITV